MRKSVEKVLYINCMFMARNDLMESNKISNDIFRRNSIERSKISNKNKAL